MNDIHALINQFLQQHTLAVRPQSDSEALILKAGLLPYIKKQGQYFYYFMKPQAKNPALPAPPFQICKGTRMHYSTSAGWQDMEYHHNYKDVIETLPQTALREAIEELGLKLQNIKTLIALGDYGFVSASTGNDKRMWLLAAEMVRADDFLPIAEIAPSTAECAWLSAAEFGVVGRIDHRYILADIETTLGSQP